MGMTGKGTRLAAATLASLVILSFPGNVAYAQRQDPRTYPAEIDLRKLGDSTRLGTNAPADPTVDMEDLTRGLNLSQQQEFLLRQRLTEQRLPRYDPATQAHTIPTYGGTIHVPAMDIPSPTIGGGAWPPRGATPDGEVSTPIDRCAFNGFDRARTDSLRRYVRGQLSASKAAQEKFDRADQSTCIADRVRYYLRVLAALGGGTP